MTTTEFSFAKLLKVAQVDLEGLWVTDDALARRISRRIQKGDILDATMADHWAMSLHLHPGDVWEEWWDAEWTPVTMDEIRGERMARDRKKRRERRVAANARARANSSGHNGNADVKVDTAPAHTANQTASSCPQPYWVGPWNQGQRSPDTRCNIQEQLSIAS